MLVLLFIMWVVFFSMIFFVYFEDELRGLIISKCYFIWMGLGLLIVTISLLLLYNSPHQPFFPGNTAKKAVELLNCAKKRFPILRNNFTNIEKCLHQVSVYSVRNGRLPYFRKISEGSYVPDAFVIRSDSKSVFVTEKYKNYPIEDRALIMIHECAHIGLGAHDYAYRWQPEFENLTEEQHFKNADSFMDLVLRHCTLSYDTHVI